jgi:myo-inositol-1(or 4)-monophosphatase
MNDIDVATVSRIRRDAEELAKKAGVLLADEQTKFTIHKIKDPAGVDLSTSADIKSEKFIMDFIHANYPKHGIFAEESGITDGSAEYVWVIDPLDGTKEYARGLSEYNCLIAVEYHGELVVGITQRNGVNELYSAMKGNPSLLNGKPIHVSKESDMSKAFIGFHIPTKSKDERVIDTQLGILNRFVKQCYRVRPGWDDAKLAGWVARGVLDAHIISMFKGCGWYDIAPGILQVESAGGIVTDLDGNPIKNRDLSHGMVLANREIHAKILDIIHAV